MITEAADITLKQGEAKTLTFTITSGGSAVNCSGATFYFAMKKEKRNTDKLIEKQDASFGKGNAANGIVTVPVSATDTNQEPGKYYGELKTTFAADNIDKSADIIIEIEKAVV